MSWHQGYCSSVKVCQLKSNLLKVVENIDDRLMFMNQAG